VYEKLSFMRQIKKGIMSYYLKNKMNRELRGIERWGCIRY
jgi:hypothetical protein